MDANSFIEFLNKPFRERLATHYAFYQAELEKGFMTGRMGDAPVDRRMAYKDLFSDTFREVLVFGSNSYLNLGNHPYVLDRVCDAVRQYGTGTGGSPAFSGYTRQHRDLEQRLAALAGHEDALLLPSGYMANLCWVNGLMTRQDILLYDKHSHASVINAIKMTGVQFFPYDPDNLPALEKLIAELRARPGSPQLFATVEGVRSTDGSVIQLRTLLDLCKCNDIFVILDDAHGLGVLGERGWGTLEHLDLLGQVDMRMSTCSKALGAQGAWVSGSREAIFYLRSYAKPYVFTTALAQTTVATISAALDVMEREPERRRAVHANRRYLTQQLRTAGFTVGDSDTGIVPVYLPDGVAGRFNRALYEQGLFVNVMEYPMVAPGAERLRFSLMAQHTRDDIDRAVAIVTETARAFGLVLAQPTAARGEPVAA
ncbi:aminotransferase class I/II-fold pyridoxal phosphate-dependent enzyme [Chitiniphilus eburneus]|uniref:Putative 8-amino-7-oxononanoate synthase n=1 Tax=Chitiniphilus eburneus TaxID=2571148 RepID=A0A4U0PQX8_9NEIS|nr:aminotransferase class I/II-fold pyridoxal phosphate-dependent enzyme [Chitiniphilus eburneus]TJZ70736.1 aminotransferase class I/II-fold pyridoxal phosphate-dependent enzyme [Chitiniphilus eburneus]